MTSLTRVFPHAREITNISNTNPAVVTTDEAFDFLDGSFITIFIPYANVMEQINGKTYLITILSDTTFSIPVDATRLTPWVNAPDVTIVPPVGAPYQTPGQVAQAIPAAEFATTLENASNVIGPNNP